MADSTPNTSPVTPTPAPRRRRWLRVVLVLLVLLVIGLALLVALAPTLLSTTPGKNLAMSIVNKSLNGRAELADWSIGWTSGVSITELKVYESTPQGDRLVLAVGRISTPLSLVGLARGNFDLGETVIESLNLISCVVDQNGVTNYQKLFKTDPSVSSTSTTSTSNAAGAASPLPDIKGSVRITDLRGTISGPGVPQPVHIESSNLHVNIPDVNQPITNDVNLSLRVGNGAVGRITLAGTLKAISNNLVDVSKLTSDQKISISNLDVASITPFVQMSGTDLTLTGLMNGALSLNATSVDDLSLVGQIDVTSLSAGGAVLNGDTFSTSKFSLPLDVRRSLINGAPHVNVKTLKILIDQGEISVTADAPQASLLAAAELLPASINSALLGATPVNPITLSGAAGNASVGVDLDLAAVVKQLPKTAALAQGVTFTSGRLRHTTQLTFQPESVLLVTSTQLPDLAGTNNGRAVKLSPIDLSATVTALAGARPDLRDVRVTLKSDFANVNGGGPALGQQEWKGSLDLTTLRAQLDQFVDVNALLADEPTEPSTTAPPVELAGRAEFVFNMNGDVTQPGGAIGTALQLGLSDFVARNTFGLKTASPQSVVLRYQGLLIRGKESFVDSIKDFQLQLGNGTLAAPVIAMTSRGDIGFVSVAPSVPGEAPTLSVGSANLTISAPDLPTLSVLANALMPGVVPVELTRGSLETQVNATLSPQQTRLDIPKLVVSSLAMKSNAGNASIAFDKDVSLALNAVLITDATDTLESLTVSQLAGDLGGLAMLRMPEPVKLSNLTAATPGASGTIALSGNIDRVCRFIEAVTGAPAGSGYPYSGEFNLTQSLTTDGNRITLAGKVDAAPFRVMQDGRAIFSEDRVGIVNNLTVNPSNKVLRDIKVKVSMPTSGALTVDLSGARLEDWEVKRRLTNFVVKLDYDLAKLWPIVKPMLTPEQQASYADLIIAGKFSKTYTIGGSFPVAPTFGESIKPLTIDGGFSVALLELPSMGIKLENFDRPFSLKNGIITTDASEPNPKFATLNSGTLNTNNLSVDLTSLTPRLSAPAGKRLMRGVRVPPLLAQGVLAKAIPLFGGQSDAGSLDIAFEECNRLPLGALMTLPRDPLTGEENDGRAVILITAADVKPGGQLVSQFVSIVGGLTNLGMGGFNAQSLQGEIPSGSKVTINRGVLTQDITLAVGEGDRPILRLVGGLDLKTSRFQNFNVGIPGQLIQRLPGNLKKYAPEMVNIPLGGSIASPKLQADQIIGKLVSESTQRLVADQARQLLDGKKDAQNPDAPATQPNPVGDLLDIFQKRDQERRQRDQDRRERDSAPQPAP